MLKVSARAPTRVDLAGGTLDIRPLSNLLSKPLTVNVSISVSTSTNIELGDGLGQLLIRSVDQNKEISGPFEKVIEDSQLPLLTHIVDSLWSEKFPSLKIECLSQSPAGAGLGGSSSLAVTLVSALNYLRAKLGYGLQFTENDLVRFVQDLESRIIRCPTGTQDYWGAIKGGVNLIRFPYGDFDVTTLRSDGVAWIKEHMVLVYSGVSRASGINNWNIFKSVFEGDETLLGSLNEIAGLSWQLASALKAGLVEDALAIMRAEWNLRRSLWPAVETKETRLIDQACIEAGADFTKVCGAGGGGVMAIFCKPELRSSVEKAAQLAGGSLLPAKVEDQGLTITEQFS